VGQVLGVLVLMVECLVGLARQIKVLLGGTVPPQAAVVEVQARLEGISHRQVLAATAVLVSQLKLQVHQFFTQAAAVVVAISAVQAVQAVRQSAAQVARVHLAV
jgi:hypothetical protein